MDNSSVKDNISKFRRASGLSQAEVAEMIGISRTAYRNIEMGGTRLMSEKIEAIAASLNTSTEKLILGYQPSEDDARKLQDTREQYQLEKSKLLSDHEAEVASLKEKMRTMQECIDAQRETIKTKDEIIAMMRKNNK